MPRARFNGLLLFVPLLLALLWFRHARQRSGLEVALLAAAEEGDAAAVSTLLDQGVNPNARDPATRDTALLLAFRSDRREVAAVLLQRGAAIPPVQATGFDLLSIAAGRGDVNSAELLLDRGANPNARGRSGRTPLMRALGGGQILARSQAALAATRTGAYGFREPVYVLPSQTAVRSTVRLLLDRGADVRLLDTNGAGALHTAAALPDARVAGWLLARGADVNARDGQGFTPLAYAVSHRDASAVRLLLDHHADPNARDAFGCTPLAYAALMSEPELVRLLLARGGDPTIRAPGGRSVTDQVLQRLRRQQGVADLLRAAALPAAAARKAASVGRP
jgi:cytohesin